ncbi:MAG TPA: BTAD domain-containing putative transcriptional regulator [Kribbellaceae bacterium]|nr:BTAD domain-containing putative transcriptional regulator [Kribbellaceae bacterium]
MKYFVLGPLEVAGVGGRPVAIRAKRIRALLAILLLHADKVVPLDRIIDGIWSDDPPRSALENVRTYISQLRSTLAQAGDRERLESHPGGYRLRTDPEQLDLHRFTTLAANGRQALRVGDYVNAVSLLGNASNLWRGAPLAELELGSCVRAKTIALEEQRWQVQNDWISARLAMGERTELVAGLQEMLGERPLDEGIWAWLITVLHSAGRTSEALAAFTRARNTLVAELGVEPGQALRDAHAAVLEGTAVLDAPRPGPKALSSAASTPHQLPPAVAGLVGRTTELRRVRSLVERLGGSGIEHVPVALVTGAPGIGKTAMAVAAGIEAGGACPDGELYLDLRGSTDNPLDSGDALADLLVALGLTPEAIPATLEHRRSLYRSMLAERRMLIVLDDAVNARQVAGLLPGLGRSLVIVTSRRWLAGIDADLHLGLEPLSRDEAVEMLGRLIGSERVNAEYAAAVSIVEACGRLPTAIRIAGARLAARAYHPLRFLAARLRDTDRVLDELTVDGLSLRRLFDTSYRGLEPLFRRLFGVCSLSPSEQITAVSVGRVLRLPVHAADRQLERLVHEGLLSSCRPDRGVPTYQMSAVLHLYARECLDREVTRQCEQAS